MNVAKTRRFAPEFKSSNVVRAAYRADGSGNPEIRNPNPELDYIFRNSFDVVQHYTNTGTTDTSRGFLSYCFTSVRRHMSDHVVFHEPLQQNPRLGTKCSLLHNRNWSPKLHVVAHETSGMYRGSFLQIHYRLLETFLNLYT